MGFNILNKALFIIRHNQQEIEEIKNKGDEFDSFIKNLINDINQNDTVRMYKVRSELTEVVNNTKMILEKYIDSKYSDEISDIEECFKNIANRLLIKEVDIQEKIIRMGISVQKGSLIEALLYDTANDEYSFLLAKVEHIDIFDDVDFARRSGYSTENNKMWKSALFKFDTSDNKCITIQEIKIFLDSNVKYWTDSFLEIDPMNEDDKNTLQAFKSIEMILSRNIKKNFPKDYTTLRNSVICYFRNNTWFDYSEMVNSIFKQYDPMEMNRDIHTDLTDKIIKLPNNNKFDSQFNINQKIITARVRKVYEVNNNIELKIKDGLDDLNGIIKAFEDENTGKKYLQIETNNDDTYNCFK